jgi:CRP-like cAMP-binding protein
MLVTTTATSVDGNTSEFSANYMVIASVGRDISPEVLVYPNPCRDHLMIVIPAGLIRSVAVITAGGKRVYQKNNINDNSFNWNFGNTLQAGLYFAEIELTNGSRSTQKITVIR